MSDTLAFRALQDRLTALQLDVNQLKRNASMGVPIEWQPIPHWPSDGATTEDPDALGSYVRHGQHISGWFVTRTTGNSHSGTGPFYVFMPPNYSNLGAPTIMELDEMGGSGHVYGGLSVIGYWTAAAILGTMHGWIFRALTDPTAFGFGYTSAYPTGTPAEADGTVFNKDTVVRGWIDAEIKAGF